MPRVKTVSVTYGRKVNLGNYNSCEIGLQLWADLEEFEDPEQVVRDLQGQARDLARAEYLRLTNKLNGTPANGRVKD